jgi:excisionase family DNA binding protein
MLTSSTILRGMPPRCRSTAAGGAAIEEKIMADCMPREIADSIALSVEEACELTSLGRTTFYGLMKSKKIPARKCGRRTIIILDELYQALKSLPRAGGMA